MKGEGTKCEVVIALLTTLMNGEFCEVFLVYRVILLLLCSNLRSMIDLFEHEATLDETHHRLMDRRIHPCWDYYCCSVISGRIKIVAGAPLPRLVV